MYHMNVVTTYPLARHYVSTSMWPWDRVCVGMSPHAHSHVSTSTWLFTKYLGEISFIPVFPPPHTARRTFPPSALWIWPARRIFKITQRRKATFHHHRTIPDKLIVGRVLSMVKTWRWPLMSNTSFIILLWWPSMKTTCRLPIYRISSISEGCIW
jgi:hypothetical protein